MGSLYEILGVERGADTAEIRKAYMKLARTHHPDKGGDAEKFKQIQKAYEVLSDEGRRQTYDMTGSDGEDGGGGGPGGPPGGGMPFPFPFDLGAMFGGGGIPMGMFGGGGRRRTKQKGAKAPPKIHEMPISLWDFYHGKTITIQFDRQAFCDGCKGSGAESWETCRVCGGSGSVQQMLMMGPGMQTLMTGPCTECRTEGKKIGKVCGGCGGKKMKPQGRRLEVRVEPGMGVGETIVFPKECSDDEDYLEAGDLHIVLRQADEDGRFRRGGAGREDLVVDVSVGLREALLGYTEKVEGHPAHPEGLILEIPAGVQNGDVLRVAGEGMRQRGGSSRGDLHVRVRVMPTEAEREALRAGAEKIREVFAGTTGTG